MATQNMIPNFKIWWNNLSHQSQKELKQTYFPNSGKSLPNHQIEQIYKSENFPPSIQSKEEGKHTHANVEVRGDYAIFAIFSKGTPKEHKIRLALVDGYSEEATANAARFAQCWNEYDQLKERITQLEKLNNDLEHYVGYVEDTIGRGAVPRLEFDEWLKSGKPLTK